MLERAVQRRVIAQFLRGRSPAAYLVQSVRVMSPEECTMVAEFVAEILEQPAAEEVETPSSEQGETQGEGQSAPEPVEATAQQAGSSTLSIELSPFDESPAVDQSAPPPEKSKAKKN